MWWHWRCPQQYEAACAPARGPSVCMGAEETCTPTLLYFRVCASSAPPPDQRQGFAVTNLHPAALLAAALEALPSSLGSSAVEDAAPFSQERRSSAAGCVSSFFRGWGGMRDLLSILSPGPSMSLREDQ